MLVIFSAALARAETPLYEEEPYDQITLNAANNNEVLKIKPLDPAIRQSVDRPAEDPKGNCWSAGSIDPDKEYEVLWRNDRQGGIVRAVGPEQGQRVGGRGEV